MIIGNKSDLSQTREVETSEGQTLAEKNGAFFFETSALDGSNVEEAFMTLLKKIYDESVKGNQNDSNQTQDVKPVAEQTVDLKATQNENGQKKGCC